MLVRVLKLIGVGIGVFVFVVVGGLVLAHFAYWGM